MKKVLVCPPSYYDIEYEINPWMSVQNKVDQKKVRKEFEALKKVYTELGVEMLEIPQEQGLPDMVYAANFGFPIGDMFIKSNFKYDERKREADISKLYFEAMGMKVKELPKDINWEGQGDFLTIGGRFFLGWGKRSDSASKEYLDDMLGVDVVDFELINPYYYHLDTCFTLLDEDTVAINPQSFTPEGLRKIFAHFSHVIPVSEKDNDLIACNSVVVGKMIVTAKGISNDLKDAYAQYGFTTREVPMDEFRKGGGSVKCLTLEFH